MDVTGLPPEPPGPPKPPKKSALQKLQEEMQRQWAPFRQIQEMQDLVDRYSPERQMRDLRMQFDPGRELREALERTSLSKRLQDALDQTSISSRAQKLYEQYFPKDTFSGLGPDNAAFMKTIGLSLAEREYQRYLEPLTKQQDLLDRAQRQALGEFSIQEHLRQIEQANPAFAALEAAKKQMDAMLGQFRDIDFSAFENVGDEERDEAQAAADSISKAATAEPTLQGAVDQILAAIQAQKKPAVQVMLLFIFKKMLDYLIAGAIGVVMGYYAPTVLGDSPQAAAKSVKEVAREVVGAPELLVDYRYVSTKVLIVRQNPRALSPEVARLTFGKPVKLVKKEKDFTLVVWSDKESGAEIQGWVFARYLGKFN